MQHQCWTSGSILLSLLARDGFHTARHGAEQQSQSRSTDAVMCKFRRKDSMILDVKGFGKVTEHDHQLHPSLFGVHHDLSCYICRGSPRPISVFLSDKDAVLDRCTASVVLSLRTASSTSASGSPHVSEALTKCSPRQHWRPRSQILTHQDSSAF